MGGAEIKAKFEIPLRRRRRLIEGGDLIVLVYGGFTEGYDIADLKEATALVKERS